MSELFRICLQCGCAREGSLQITDEMTVACGVVGCSDPETGKRIRDKLDAICSELKIQYRGVRFRTTGYRQIIEVHLLFPEATLVSEAHRLATVLEERLPVELGIPAEVTTHLESLEDHAAVHHPMHYTGKPD